MSTPDWVDYKNDPCFGHNDPGGNADTFGRANKGIWGNLTAYSDEFTDGTGEHIKTGAHMDDLTDNLYYIEEGTYTGDGSDPRDVNLSDGDFNIKFLRIFDGSVAYTFFRSADMTGDNTKITSNATGFLADYIEDIDVIGEFAVGSSLNTNLVEYYYVAYGNHDAPPPP